MTKSRLRTFRPSQSGAAAWCREHEIKVGDTIESWFSWEGWVLVRVSAIGRSAILVCRPRCAEIVHHDPSKLREVQADA